MALARTGGAHRRSGTLVCFSCERVSVHMQVDAGLFRR
jgi:hypothetical protein